MAKQNITTTSAPQAIGPYSQGIKCGNMVFCSGQIPLDPQTGKIVSTDVVEQTRQVLSNLEAILKAAGTELASVVRTTIYLQDLGHFAKVNEVYGSFFKAPYPARATVQVARLPMDVLVEIDAIAVTA